MTTHRFKKGKFDSNTLRVGVHFCKTQEKFRVKFSKECLYTPIDWENDWNKLCGWSYGSHHDNSIRACWRPHIPAAYVGDRSFMPNKLELCLYVYERGTRGYTHQTIVVDVETEYELLLKYDKAFRWADLAVYFEGATRGVVSISYQAKPSIGYNLYPYFGGNHPAPHDMTIELKRL